MGGDRIKGYPYNVNTVNTDVTSVKYLVNSTISAPRENVLHLDIKDIYLNSEMDRKECMMSSLEDNPGAIQEYFN